MPQRRQDIISGTLLIVESPVIAESINRLRLPDVEAIATRGYIWTPKLSPNKEKLVATANPELADVRKALRLKAPAFSRICIACDEDPSGAFIAQATAKFLKGHGGIRFGKLTGLSPSALQKTTETVVAEAPDQSESLRRHFRIREAFFRLGYDTPRLQLMLAIGLLTEPHATQCFIGKVKKQVFRSVNQLTLRGSDSLTLQHAPRQGLYPEVAKPPSTAILPFVPDQYFAQTQEQLNRLFCFQDDELARHLISYPRTRTQAWHADTWTELSGQLQRQHPGYIPVPSALRRTPENDAAHEALHVSRLDFTPHSLRPFLKAGLLRLYTVLHAQTLRALSVPEEIHMQSVWTDAEGRSFRATNELSNQVDAEVYPVFELQDFMQALLDTGWIPASGLGAAMDGLLRSECIIFEKEPVPHLRLAGHPEIRNIVAAAARTKGLLQEATVLKADDSLSPVRFNTLLTQLFQDGI